MKHITLTLCALLGLAFITPGLAGDGHGHSHEKKTPGPNQGRVLTQVTPHLEFLVTKERTVAITALTPDLKPGQFSGQIITVTVGERSNPVKLAFAEKDGRLISTTTLPEGSNYPVSVGIKADAASRTVYARFNLNLATCPGCQLAEYACICGH